MGIFDEQCVLTDPENPFVNVATFEFNVNDPDAPTKFSLFEAIPQGPTGAKARFYLWATALARFPSGENQWYTARALHEVYHYNEDDIIRQQALRAYRSNLDNFFGSVTFFDVFGSSIPAPLNEIVACNIYRVGSTGWSRLVVDDQGNPANDLDVLALFGEWGYEFDAGTGDNCDGSLLTVLRF